MRIEEITRALREAVEDIVTVSGTPVVRIVPNTESINFGTGAVLPAVILNGPTVRANRHDFQKEETEGELSEAGVHAWDIRTHRQIVDLVFRVRVFARKMSTLTGALGIVDTLISNAASLEDMEVEHEDGETVTYDVRLDLGFRDDLTPNESDLDHYESEIVIDEVTLRPEDADSTAWELKDWDVEVENIEEEEE